ncbi:exosortase F system-associated membrane protein [Flavobacterium algicola]|uniref:exosortase F system-associated membrane protein n=1 Tax=Flavobacterium algicola TaxID=556529 RepID=UPI001EFCA61D|nr:exosortase F system-associated protein [Flavobacterium algicola]MCG9791347.1 exosortase F system-associated protein [Flavobacterium algicola]
MLKKILRHKYQLLSGGLVLLLLVLVRVFEKVIFYDPFLHYFELDFNMLSLPVYDAYHLFWGLLFRYGLNAVLSILLIYIIFKDSDMVKFASVLYGLFFVFLIVPFFIILNFYADQNNFILFYIRRFLIQPLFLLLFVPAFYYQRLSAN